MDFLSKDNHYIWDCKTTTWPDFYECHPDIHGANTKHGICFACSYYPERGIDYCHSPCHVCTAEGGSLQIKSNGYYAVLCSTHEGI